MTDRWAPAPDASPLGAFLERMAAEGHRIVIADSGCLPSTAADGAPGPDPALRPGGSTQDDR